jgi:hypothetical protein
LGPKPPLPSTVCFLWVFLPFGNFNHDYHLNECKSLRALHPDFFLGGPLDSFSKYVQRHINSTGWKLNHHGFCYPILSSIPTLHDTSSLGSSFSPPPQSIRCKFLQFCFRNLCPFVPFLPRIVTALVQAVILLF